MYINFNMGLIISYNSMLWLEGSEKETLTDWHHLTLFTGANPFETNLITS